jgi:Fur family ferric uptake transcriptional regulator
MSGKQLKAAGLKITLPRVKILKILESSENRHLTAEDVYKRLIHSGDDIGLATVYRVLTQFEIAGLVTRHKFEDGRAIFELSSDEHHDHMICLDSNEVIEFMNLEIEALQHKIANDKGYTLVDHSLVLYVKKKAE